MKMIHCADLHLDSAMTAHFDLETARARRGEMLRSFERMVEYACDEGVSAILIAGDMFDTANTRELTRNTILHCIRANPGIAFFYLRGNHDDNNFIHELGDQIPANLLLFSGTWSCYECGNIAIFGAELRDANGFYDGLKPDADKINITMLHGQTAENADGVEHGIDLSKLRDKNIDYLALGHIHSYCEGRLDDRGIYCYPGCLEGRGFDECGRHGFVLLDIDENKRSVNPRFIPFASRTIYSVNVDVTGCLSSREMIMKSAEALADTDCDQSSMVRLVLSGELEAECEKDISYISAAFAGRFFFFKAVDETRLKISIGDYLLDESLKGEFVRTVFDDPALSDEDKALIVRYGLRALAGEEAD